MSSTTAAPGRSIASGASRLFARRTAGWIGTSLFLAVLIGLFLKAPSIKPYLWGPKDSIWLAMGTTAAAIVCVSVWWRCGKPLFVAGGVVTTALLLTPLLSGATGWSIPKLAAINWLAIGLGQRALWLLLPGVELAFLPLLALSTSIGLGTICLLMFLLGIVGWWQVHTVVALLVLLAVLTWRYSISVFQSGRSAIHAFLVQWPQADMRLPAATLWCFCICGFGCYIFSIAPATHWDVLHYHLSIPQIYVLRGGLVDLDHTFAVHLIRNAEMLYTLGLLVEGQPLPTLFNFEFGLLSVAMITCLGTQVANRRVGLLSGVIYFALPITTYVLAEGMVDLVLTTFVLAATYAFFCWQDKHHPGWLMIFSGIAGLAAGTKINAMIFLTPLAVILMAQTCRRPFLDCLKSWARIVVPGALTLAPWLLLGWMRIGNPVFPFANNIFRSTEWPQDSVNAGLDWPGFGVGHTWAYFLRLPWDLAFAGERFGEFGWLTTAGITLLGLPLTYFLTPARQRRTMLLLVALATLELALFFRVAQYARYMLPVFASLSIVAAINCQAVWNALTRASNVRPLAVALCAVLGLTWITMTRVTHLTHMGHTTDRYPWKLAIGLQTQDQYLRQSSVSCYEMLLFINENIPQKPAIFLGAGVGCGLYSGDAIEYSRWPSLFGKRITETESTDELMTMLKEKKITHLAINHAYLRKEPAWKHVYENAAMFNRDFLRRHAELLFVRGGHYLYEFHAEEVSESPNGKSVLQNSDLHVASDGSLPEWSYDTAKLKIKPGANLDDASTQPCIAVSHDGFICQTRPICANTLYTLAVQAWSNEPGQACLLQMTWLDRKGKPLVYEPLDCPVNANPSRVELCSTSPPGAVSVLVSLRAQPNNHIFIAAPTLFQRPPLHTAQLSPSQR